MLLVSPRRSGAPGDGIQRSRQLRALCRRSSGSSPAPFAVQTASDSEVQPDVIVARFVDFRSKNLPVAPLLAVEVLSHSTRLKDRNLKKAHYERIGVASYWILDPAEPGALDGVRAGRDGRYRQVAHVEGDEEFVATRPFPVTVVPARLLDGLRPRQ